MKLIFISVLLTSYVKGDVEVSTVDDSGSPFECLKGNSTIEITCTVTVPLTSTIKWFKNGVLQTTCGNAADNTCTTPSNSRYSVTSSISLKQFIFQISAATIDVDDGSFTCEHASVSNFSRVISCECDTVQDIPNTIVNTTSVKQGTVVGISCKPGYNIEGASTLTCQPDGTWSDNDTKCGTTTTTTTTTTITSHTSITTTSSTTSTTSSSIPMSTPSISTSKAPSTVISTKSTVKAPSTSKGAMTTTVYPVADGDSDKAVITMITVVSVIGGVLIVAIFSIIFVMMHWKCCFTGRGLPNQYARRSDHRKRHREAEDNSSGRFWSTQQDLAMGGYYFYNGTNKNTLFYDPFENSSYVNNYYPNQKNYHDPKYMSTRETYQYN